MHLPTRRPFDTLEGLEARLQRADRAFTLTYALGCSHVIANVGGLPSDERDEGRTHFATALAELAGRADHRGVRLAIATGPDSGETLRGQLEQWGHPSLAVSLDPGALQRFGHDPAATTVALGPWVAHAFALGPAGGTSIVSARGPRSNWEEYLGALEEIDYRGYLTLQVDPTRDEGTQFRAFAEMMKRF